ncbi:MAG: hypothetical protein HN383_18260 [Verrucomicrobia bacterium]|jgi:thioredoxin reductase|nr:hypothetical protein [Verrucomicrobiota bacterium]
MPMGQVCESGGERSVSAEADALVVGSGPAGCAAGLCAGRVGASVLLAESCRIPAPILPHTSAIATVLPNVTLTIDEAEDDC